MDTSGNLLDVTEELEEQMKKQAERFSVSDLIFCTRKFLEARNQIAESNIATLPLELAVAEICTEWGNVDRTSDIGSPVKSGGGASSVEAVKGSKSPKKGDEEEQNKNSSKASKKGKKKKKNEKNESVEEKKDESKAEEASLDITPEEIQAKWNNVLRASRKVGINQRKGNY